MIGAITAGLYGTGVPPVTNSYESIATVTGGGSSITFSSIPSTFTHLQIRVYAPTSGGATGLVFYNSDTTQGNYYSHFLVGNGTSATAAAYNNPYSWSYGTVPTAAVMDILDYKNTNKYKTQRTLRGWDNNGSGNVSLESILWKNTAAINAITIQPDAGTWSSSSVFALYGIKG